MSSAPPTPTASGVCYMTRDQVREEVERNAKANGDKRQVEIYDYETRALGGGTVPMAQLVTLVAEARRGYMELRRAHPEETDKALRKRMMDADPRFKSMGDKRSGTHVTLFKKLTARDTPREHLRVIEEMMQMRARHEQVGSGAGAEAATQEVTAYFSTRIKAVHEKHPQAPEVHSDEEEEDLK